MPLLHERERVLPLRESVENFSAAVVAQAEALGRLRNGLEFSDTRRFGPGGLEDLSWTELGDLLGRWQHDLGTLKAMAALNHVLSDLAAPELEPLVAQAVLQPGVGAQAAGTFRHAWLEQLAETVLGASPRLEHFNGADHEEAVRAFRTLDQSVLGGSRKRLALIHQQGLPSASEHGQMRVLGREFQKKTRHLPVRQLMLRAGNAVQRVKPLLMMSPLSIAQFVPPESLSFDLVVFDEASQVRPAEALGAVVRGEQTVVVGDSRQLPPTSFFSVFAGADEDAETATGDLESVLGLFVAQGAPERRLRWHYRSRHESLIAVSNREFYDDRLLVFPGPDWGRADAGLVFHHLPETVYSRGGSGANVLEAQAVARAVMAHARTRPELTLGVAAFSAKQMTVIEDSVEALRRERPDCESFFARHPHEPFFVKNLETVQGDERDVILISLSYGRDAHGKVSMNFGPLNQSGGERRLNVLITRARRRCEVFANITADDLDTRKTNAWGVRALKTFLHYARHGELGVPEASGREFGSPFEEAVYRALTGRGYALHKQVGSAGYFIDLAVVDPDRPGRYLLGIECDGASYHSARSARDRDRLRQGVLEGLGWRLHRVWSTDFFRHPERELERAVEAIERARLGAPVCAPEGPDGAPAELERHAAAASPEDERTIFYELARLPLELATLPELHLVPAQRLADLLVRVVETESPVHRDEVARRILEAAGVRRRGARIAAALAAAARLAEERGQVVLEGAFLRLPTQHTFLPRDRSRLPAAARRIELVAPQELEAAVLGAVTVSSGLSREALPAVAARALGFNRAGGATFEAFQGAVDRLLGAGRLVHRGEDLVVP